jgi:hypothetical protein
MPQLDFTTFFSQLVISIIILSLLFLFFSVLFLPAVYKAQRVRALMVDETKIEIQELEDDINSNFLFIDDIQATICQTVDDLLTETMEDVLFCADELIESDESELDIESEFCVFASFYTETVYENINEFLINTIDIFSNNIQNIESDDFISQVEFEELVIYFNNVEGVEGGVTSTPPVYEFSSLESFADE